MCSSVKWKYDEDAPLFGVIKVYELKSTHILQLFIIACIELTFLFSL